MTLEDTLADLRERVTMLRVEGHPVQAASVERAIEQLVACLPEYLVLLSEPEAVTYSGRSIAYLLAAFDPRKGAEWRPWVALTLCGYQGARQHAVLHLKWADVDLASGTLTWRAEFDKAGREWTQPLRVASRAALELAATRAVGRSWVLPGFGQGGEAPYTIQALWVALRRAEERAGIPHRPRRGAHGLRRLLAGEVNARTGNAKLAMDAIGDRDIRQMERYLRPREDAVRDAFEAMDQGGA